MAIKSFTIKNCATFDADGVTFEDCQKVNFIFGANGSGKTTISRQLEEYQRTGGNTDCCVIEPDGNAPTRICVYNRDFRKKYFENDDELPGVFTLGVNVETKHEIEKLEQKIDSFRTKIEAKRPFRDKKQNELDSLKKTTTDSLWEQIVTRYRDSGFKFALQGSRSKKETFFDTLLKYDAPEVTLTASDLELRLVPLLSEATKIQQFDGLVDFIKEITSFESQVENILNEVVVGNEQVDVAGLIQELNISAWVNQGRAYLKPGDDTCPFCQKKTIDDQFREKLDLYFSGNFQKKMGTIKNLVSNCRAYLERFTSFYSNLHNLLDALKGKVEYLTEKDLIANKETVLRLFAEIEAALSQKENKPTNTNIAIPSLVDCLQNINAEINKINAQIDRFNDAIDNQKDQKETLKKEIWQFFVQENRDTITTFKTQQTELDKQLKRFDDQIDEYQTQLDETVNNCNKKREEIQTVEDTVVEINRMLTELQFNNFKLKTGERKGTYQIIREDEKPATTTLSEGEVSFISFLYFLHRAQETKPGKANEKRVMIIDDPASSQDGKTMFTVVALILDVVKKIKAKIGNVEQLFLLTHNVYFHKEISYDRNYIWSGVSRKYWTLYRFNLVSQLYCYESKNPIKTNYELLWKEYKRAKEEIETSNDLEKNKLLIVSVQNNMRRIFENFYKWLGYANYQEAIENILQSDEEKEAFSSLNNWMNAGSHSIVDPLNGGAEVEAFKIYLDSFEMVFKKSNYITHYNMMMGITESDKIGDK